MNYERRLLPRIQIEQPQLIPPADACEFLFPQREINLRDFLGNLRPNPLDESELLILRINPEFGEKPVRGFWLGREKHLEKGKIEAGNIGEIVHSQTYEGKTRRTSGIVIFIEPKSLDEFEKETVIDSLASLLGKEGKIWVLEGLESNQKLSPQEKNSRLRFLEELGLVDRKVVMVNNYPFILWYGREEKERRRVCIDLTQRPWFERTLGEMIRYYKDQEGWAEVDPTEIIAACSKSSFALRDYWNLRGGLGVVLTAHCGCQWHVDFEGNLIKLPGSHDEECDGVLLPEVKKEQIGPSIIVGKEIVTEVVCADCGEQIHILREIVGTKKSPNNRIAVKSTRWCPGCEFKVVGVRYVPEELIIDLHPKRRNKS